jgi:hypothetical protein
VLGRGRWQQVVVMCEQYKEQEGIGQIDRYSLGGADLGTGISVC